MTPRAIYAAALGVAIAMVGESAAAAQNHRSGLVDYVVQEGDTCMGIAKRVLGSRRHYRQIHKHNPNMGPTPHRLKPGTVLRLPRADRQAADAHLTGKRGDVQVRRPTTERWNPATRGMELFRTWRVHARERSNAEITFQDESSIRMRENTVVIIYGGSRRRARRRTTTASLQKGALRTRLGELDRGRLVVTTPSSRAEISGGTSVVSVDDDGTSRIANHTGKPIKVRSKRRRRSVRVAARMGTKVERGKPPSKPRKLPASPVWQPDPRAFVGSIESGGTIRGRWQPVARAHQYRVEIASDEHVRSVIARAFVPARVNGFEAHGLPPGTYHIRVAAIDDDAFEGPPSPVASMRVLGLALRLPDGVSDARDRRSPAAPGVMLDVSQPGAPLRAIPGAQVIAPDGVTCAIAPGASGAVVALTEPGAHQVTCQGPDGALSGALDVDIAGVTASPSLPDGQPLTALPREVETAIELAIQAHGFELPTLRAVASPGVAVGAIERVAPGRFTVAVTPAVDAPARAELQLVVGADAAAVTLARVALDIAAPPAPAPTVTRPAAPVARRARWSVSVFTGGSLRSSDYELGVTERISVTIGSGPLVGVRVGFSPHRRVVLEAELTAARPSLTTGDSTDLVYGYRAHVRAPLADWRIQPFAVAGLGAHGVLVDHPDVGDDRDLDMFYYGLGARMDVARQVSVRLDARHILVPGRSSRLVSNFEALLGASRAF